MSAFAERLLDQSRTHRKCDVLVDLAERQGDTEVGQVQASVQILDHVSHPVPVRVPDLVNHLWCVGFDEHDMVEARNRLVLSELLERVEVPRSGRQDLDQ